MINPRPLLSGQLHPHSLSNHAQDPHVFFLAVAQVSGVGPV